MYLSLSGFLMGEDGFRIFEQVSFHVLTVEESLRPCREGILCFFWSVSLGFSKDGLCVL